MRRPAFTGMNKYRIPKSQVAADVFHLILVSPHCAELRHEARHAVLMQKGVVGALLRLHGKVMGLQLEEGTWILRILAEFEKLHLV